MVSNIENKEIFMIDDNVMLRTNINKIHSTEMGIERIKRNLKLENIDVILWCKERIMDKRSKINTKGKNWYINCGDCIITVNRNSYTIITAHKTIMELYELQNN